MSNKEAALEKAIRMYKGSLNRRCTSSMAIDASSKVWTPDSPSTKEEFRQAFLSYPEGVIKPSVKAILKFPRPVDHGIAYLVCNQYWGGMIMLQENLEHELKLYRTPDAHDWTKIDWSAEKVVAEMIHRIRNSAGYTSVEFLEQLYRPDLAAAIEASIMETKAQITPSS